MKKIISFIGIFISISCTAQNNAEQRNREKQISDSTYRSTMMKFSNSKANQKGTFRYYKEQFDKTGQKVYLDSANNIIRMHNRNLNTVDSLRRKRFKQ